MRSRIEVRWALILDKLGLQWEYEPQGYKFSNGVMYLPDFAIYSDDTWFLEVKGIHPNEQEIEKATLLAKGLKTNVVIVWNGIPPRLSHLSTMSINKTGRVVLRNPLVEAFKVFDKDKRERILGIARSFKFDK